MKKSIACLLFLAVMLTAQGQDSATPRRITLVAKITGTASQYNRAYLHSLNDSSLYITYSRVPVYVNAENMALQKLSYQDIEKLSFKRKGSVVRGLVFGILAGTVLGAIIGRATYHKDETYSSWDFGPDFSTSAGGLIGLLSGGISGVIIGSLAKRTFIIGGQRDAYRKMHADMRHTIYDHR